LAKPENLSGLTLAHFFSPEKNIELRLLLISITASHGGDRSKPDESLARLSLRRAARCFRGAPQLAKSGSQ